VKAAKTVLVIPAYNEGRTLGGLVRAVLQQEPRLIDEVIVVDDGSTDDCLSEVPQDARVRCVRHARNEGKARALLDGVQLALAAGAARIMTMDGDGQHRPDDIPRLIEAADRRTRTIVIGARLADRANIPSARYRANRFANFWIAWASGFRVTDSQSGFRLYPAEALRAVLPRLAARYPATTGSRRKGFVFESELLIECGHQKFDTIAVGVPALYETVRASHFRPVADITQIAIMVASQLLRRGLYLRGLRQSLTRRPHEFSD
jgi:glycosyltransferase involved in cell wall biosynthesis